jgi:VWFA-related protein
MDLRTRSASSRLLVGCLAFVCGLPWSANPGAPAPPVQANAAAIPVDVLVLDRDGRLVENLRPSDFTVTVDGGARSVLWVRRVSRGPGAATEAASRQAAGDGSILYAAELRRNVVVVVDQSTLPRGDERTVVQAAGAFLDRLGIDDRLAVVRIPMSSDTQLTLTTERPAARQVLSRVVGQAIPGQALAADELAAQAERSRAIEPDREKVTDPNRPAVGEPPQPMSLPATPRELSEGDAAQSHSGLGALQALLQALRRVPGRKAVALFSAGLPASAPLQVTETAAAAVAARAAIYAFGMRSSLDGPRNAPDLTPIETLARATGGAFAMLDRNPERIVERAATELSACYVLGIQADPSDADGKRHALRVETTRKGLTVRAGAWLSTGPDPGDQVPPSPSRVEAGPALGASPLLVARPSPDAAHEAELKLALARLFDYAEGYERQYSMLVAEEDYRQSHRSGRIHLRSDFLLVMAVDRWVSFRDVFEVDGKPVRDRDDRLKRLFLDPTPEAQARLQAVMDESARYNVGPVIRNINVPLFPLSILRTYNRLRFDFKLAREENSAGVRVWRVEYSERLRPTLVEDLQGDDVPISGWFLVDQLTGAIVETSVQASRGPATGETLVRYRRDPVLGLWVPVQMRETFRNSGRSIGDGQATYSNFRRFQVTTEEKIVIPKK